MAVMICFYYSNVHFYFHFHFDRQQCRPEMREWILERDSCRDFFFLPPPTPPPYPSFFVCFKTKKPKRKREREKWANKTLEDDKNFGGMQVRNWGVAKDLWVGNSRRKHTVRRIFLFWNFLFFESSGFWWRVASAALQTWRETRIKERDRRTWKVLKALKIEMMVLDNTFPRDSAT